MMDYPTKMVPGIPTTMERTAKMMQRPFLKWKYMGYPAPRCAKSLVSQQYSN